MMKFEFLDATPHLYLIRGHVTRLVSVRPSDRPNLCAKAGYATAGIELTIERAQDV